ncbi:MAG TPA: type 2 lanthipeptide synthetase LanM, partial [Chloroflexia bacterium]|nr:type 2 lanthipeptide synthetase LanM [Chloroflexia bacterium]
GGPFDAAAALAAATTIAAEIRDRAVRTPGSATWLSVQYVLGAGQYQLRPAGYPLYHGGTGVALFLAALEHVTGGAGFRDLALAALDPLRRQLGGPAPGLLVREDGLGGASGAGSVVYGLVRTAQWLCEPTLLVAARQAAALITPAAIAADTRLDVAGGVAGAILGLLALYAASGEEAVLDRAEACALHLLVSRRPSAQGPRAWPTLGGSLLTGLAHGAAGIAYALLRLYAVTGESDFRAAAEEAIAYEASLFVPEAGNWPDLRRASDGATNPDFMTAWCHGAPGIGLARLGGLGVLDTPAVRADIAAALATTLAATPEGVDHLCCGNCGRMDLLLAAARHLSRPDLVAAAQARAAWMLERAAGTGGFYLSPDLPAEIPVPGLFQGTAGIGYTLLRLVYPDRLPSVLLWE